MDDKHKTISSRAYEIWEREGRPHGRHDAHWHQAAAELGHGSSDRAGSDPHPGMLGDGTEEQNLNQPGNPDARITEAEVTAAFGSGSKTRAGGQA